MSNFDEWKEKSLLVTNLHLDPLNPRIPEADTNLSQRELIADLVKNEKIYELAKSIVEKGYFPDESLIVVHENGKKFVLEGNRRVAALKLIISPSAAPADSERKFRSLSNRVDINTIRKVKTVVAPSREAAAPVIMSKHTDNNLESWSPVMQAKFYKNLIDQGLKVDAIAQQFNTTPSKITTALQKHTMYSIACGLELPDDISKKVTNPREFPMSTLERLYKSPNVAQFLGISFDENKQLVGKVDIKEFKKGYTRIVTDIAKGDVGSRQVNSIKDMDEYLASINDDKPNLSKKGSFNANALLQGLSPVKTLLPQHKGIQKKAKPKLKPAALIPAEYTCDVDNQRINDVFNELQKLKVAQFPNAVGIMYRSLLEMSLGHYLEQTGHLQNIIAKQKEKVERKPNNKLPSNWHPTLKQMLNYVIEPTTNIINNPNLLKALKKIVSEKDNLISIDSLDLFVHNQFLHPNEQTLREFWSQTKDLFEIILVEPDDNY